MVKLRSAFIAFLLLVVLTSAACAEYVFDQANLFTPEQTIRLESACAQIAQDYRIDMVVLTTYDVKETSSDSVIQSFADNWFERNGRGVGDDRAGVLYMLDMTNRAPCISTMGVMIDYINDARLEELFESSYESLRSGNYGNAALYVVNKVGAFMKTGREEGSFRYDAATGKRLSGLYNALTKTELGVAVLVGIVIALISYAATASRYRMDGAAPVNRAAANGEIKIVNETEQFLREQVTRTRKVEPTNNSGGGSGSSGRGSAVHISSSGASHGGGVGRRF